MSEPQATEVFVTGLDRRLLRPLQAVKRDVDRQDPLIAVESRPDGWIGESREYGWVDGTLTTQDAVNRACDLLFERMHVPRFFCQWEGNLLIHSDTGIPLWPGDVVSLKKGPGEDPEVFDVRIISLSCEFELEPWENLSQQLVRPTTYVAEKLTEEATATGHRTLGTTIVELRAMMAGMIESVTVGPDADKPWARRQVVGGPVIR
ncbi:hypothetical protein KW797_04090 [Candidatus Parcubacteria bacterium]|nr:hypothetical protein [Candidatus Parcubacteria bacterium]